MGTEGVLEKAVQEMSLLTQLLFVSDVLERTTPAGGGVGTGGSYPVGRRFEDGDEFGLGDAVAFLTAVPRALLTSGQRASLASGQRASLASGQRASLASGQRASLASGHDANPHLLTGNGPVYIDRLALALGVGLSGKG